MNVELGLKKIESLELEKKILPVKLFDANDLLNNVKTCFCLIRLNHWNLILSVARSASSKLDQMLSVQKSSSDKTGLGYVDSIFVPAPHSTKFVPSSSSSEPSVSEIVNEIVKPSVSEVAKPIEGSSSRKIRVNLKESKPKKPTLSKDKTHDKPSWVCHFCRKTGHIRPNCYKLQAAKRANKPKVLVPQVLDPMVLIVDLVKTLNLYSNSRVGNHPQMNKNSSARGASKSFWMQKTRPN